MNWIAVFFFLFVLCECVFTATCVRCEATPMAESLNSSFLRTKQQKGKKKGTEEETRNDDNDDGGGRRNEPNAQALCIFSWCE